MTRVVELLPVGFAVAAGLAVLAVVRAVLGRPGVQGWGTGWTTGRLANLGRAAWAGRRVEAAERARRADSPDRIRDWIMAVVAAVTAAALSRLCGAGPGVSALTGIGGAWGWSAYAASRRAVERRQLGDGLEEALETVVAGLRAGRTVAAALTEAAAQARTPLRDVLQQAVDSDRAGRPLATALAESASGLPVPEIEYLVACLETHLRTGGDVTPLLINLGGVVRERRRLVGDMAGRTAEARSTSILLALLPPGLLAYILAVDPSQILALAASTTGSVALLAATGLWIAGVLIIRAMLAGLTREIEDG